MADRGWRNLVGNSQSGILRPQSALHPQSAIRDVYMLVARRYLISGRVQGVGFRYFAEAAASREGVHGWVRNLPDGRVEAAAEGEAEAVQRFERSIRHGPRGARVDEVDVYDDLPAGLPGFSVR